MKIGQHRLKHIKSSIVAYTAMTNINKAEKIGT